MQDQRDTLKDYENDEIKNMGKLQGQEVMKNTNPQENFEDDSIRKIEEIDNKKRALSEISVKPK